GSRESVVSRSVLAGCVRIRSGTASTRAREVPGGVPQAARPGAPPGDCGARPSPLAPRESRDLAADFRGWRGRRGRDAARGRQMRILWVKVDGLWPLDSGGRLRSFHIIAELARRHRVTVVTAHGPQDDPGGLAAPLAACERVISYAVFCSKKKSSPFTRAAVVSCLAPVPVRVRSWCCPAARKGV